MTSLITSSNINFQNPNETTVINMNHFVLKERSQKFPKKPFHVVPSHFIVDKNIKKIILIITEYLSNIIEVSFKFNSEIYVWECVFVRGSAYCKFEIRLYNADEKDKIIVEGIRLTGDSFSFYVVYNEIKAAFAEEGSRIANANAVGSIMPGISDNLEEHEALEALQPILNMAHEQSIYSGDISAQIFCDLTYQNDMESALYTTNAIEIMSELFNVICDRCKRYEIDDKLKHLMSKCKCVTTKCLVILGISELSNKPKFHCQIVKAHHLLRNLFKFATDGPYYNVHMRRAAALIIANCSTKGWANTIVKTIGKERLKLWFHTTACIKDKILKNEIERSKKALKKVMIF